MTMHKKLLLNSFVTQTQRWNMGDYIKESCASKSNAILITNFKLINCVTAWNYWKQFKKVLLKVLTFKHLAWACWGWFITYIYNVYFTKGNPRSGKSISKYHCSDESWMKQANLYETRWMCILHQNLKFTAYDMIQRKMNKSVKIFQADILSYRNVWTLRVTWHALLLTSSQWCHQMHSSLLRTITGQLVSPNALIEMTRLPMCPMRKFRYDKTVCVQTYTTSRTIGHFGHMVHQGDVTLSVKAVTCKHGGRLTATDWL